MIKFMSQSGPRAEKHLSSWKHPVSIFIFHYFTISMFTMFAHDLLLLMFLKDDDDDDKRMHTLSEDTRKRQLLIARFTLTYFSILITYRILINRGKKTEQIGILYDSTWLCNSTLYMAAIGLWTQREILVLSHVVTVSIDQVLWYVDLTGWALSGFRKFPIGVAKYLTWPGTTWATRVTCTHHLWTIPLLIYACDGIQHPWKTYLLSGFVMALNVSLSRWLTPFVLELRNASNNDDKHEIVKYLNVNLSHEVWKDITFEALQIKHDNPSVVVYLFRLFVRWQVFNGIILFAVLCPLSNQFYPQ